MKTSLLTFNEFDILFSNIFLFFFIIFHFILFKSNHYIHNIANRISAKIIPLNFRSSGSTRFGAYWPKKSCIEILIRDFWRQGCCYYFWIGWFSHSGYLRVLPSGMQPTTTTFHASPKVHVGMTVWTWPAPHRVDKRNWHLVTPATITFHEMPNQTDTSLML